MAASSIHSEYIRLKNVADDARATGHTAQLLPEGGTAPGGLITLTANAALPHQYDFPPAVVNGKYTLYLSGVVATLDSVNIEIRVRRDGVVEPGDTSFADVYDGV